MAWAYLGIFLITSAVLCSVGFKKFVYFLSTGYGFSVIGLGVAYFLVALIKGFDFNFLVALQCILFVLYGARLSGFLIYREKKNSGYKKVFDSVTKEGEKPMPFGVKLTIWVSVSVLYVMQTCPVFYRIYNGDGKETALPIIGILISATGLIIETLADLQKSAQKKENGNMVATKGLYKAMRCPNYFGEIVFWSGVFFGNINTFKNAGQWIIAILGYVLIVYIMINGAQRLDKRQESRYGEREEYRAYADHTPIILPLVPIYHIGKYKVEQKNEK